MCKTGVLNCPKLKKYYLESEKLSNDFLKIRNVFLKNRKQIFIINKKLLQRLEKTIGKFNNIISNPIEKPLKSVYLYNSNMCCFSFVNHNQS